MKIAGMAILGVLLVTPVEAAVTTVAAPVTDPDGLLSAETQEAVRKSAEAFRDATGKWMAVVALKSLSDADIAALQRPSNAGWSARRRGEPIGIVYLAAPQSRGGRVLVVDPDWKAVAHRDWIPLFDDRIGEKFGELAFSERVAAAAGYLVEQFPEKIAFLTPRKRRIDPSSLATARFLRQLFDWFFFAVLAYTVVRTLWPNRLKDSDRSNQAQEIRRIEKEPFRW